MSRRVWPDIRFTCISPAVSMIASVFVNGQKCGDTKAPFAVWDCDITKAVKPGGDNEVWVGIKDWFYAIPLDQRRGWRAVRQL